MSTFREAVVEAKETNEETLKETKTEPSVPEEVPAPESKTEVPLALYQELEGVPYTAVHFDVKGIWDNPDIGLRKDIETIEQAYRMKVKLKELEDGEESFEHFINEAEEALDIKHAEKTYKISKIAEWVKFMSRMDMMETLRKWV